MIAHDISGDAERKKWNWYKALSAFALILALGCLVTIIWVAWELRNYEPFTARNYYPSRPDSYEVSIIESNADITLPLSAHDIYAYTSGFQDIFIKVRFSMNASELDEFMQSTLVRSLSGKWNLNSHQHSMALPTGGHLIKPSSLKAALGARIIPIRQL